MMKAISFFFLGTLACSGAFASHTNILAEFEIEPSVSSSITTLYVQDNSIEIPGGGCFWLFYYPQFPDHCVTTYELLPDDQHYANDGGHKHSVSSKPLGEFVINGASTDTYEFFDSSNADHVVTYTAPPFSGDIILRSTSCTNVGHPCFNEDRVIRVRHKGLASLPPSSDYLLIGQTATHPDNHYANAAMNSFVTRLAREWKARLANEPILQINDISLEHGGHFDYKANWSGPHKQHIFGNDVDIHYVGAAHERKFAAMVRRLGNVRWQSVHNNHHHISLHK